jgi:hypothetical protein
METWHSTERNGQKRCSIAATSACAAWISPRLTFSEDGRELQIAERIGGRKGQTQGHFTIPWERKGPLS